MRALPEKAIVKTCVKVWREDSHARLFVMKLMLSAKKVTLLKARQLLNPRKMKSTCKKLKSKCAISTPVNPIHTVPGKQWVRNRGGRGETA